MFSFLPLSLSLSSPKNSQFAFHHVLCHIALILAASVNQKKDYMPILINNQLDTQFFMYVYFFSLHVSSSHVPITRRIIVSMRHMVCVTLCRLRSGMQKHMLLHTRRSSTQSDINHVPYWYSNLYKHFLLILVNNQFDAQFFFMYVYFYSLHVSGSHVPITRRIIASMRHMVCVTLCR